MSNLMDVLLADGQRIGERRACPPPNKPATRADHIIAEGDRKRVAYRAANQNADTAMVFGAQVGFLHAQVRILCNEAEALNVQRDTNLLYDRVHCDALGTGVWVGYSYTPGEDAQTWGPPENCHEGSPEELEVGEVWANGLRIEAALSDEVAEQIEAATLERAHQREAEAQAMGDEP